MSDRVPGARLSESGTMRLAGALLLATVLAGCAFLAPSAERAPEQTAPYLATSVHVERAVSDLGTCLAEGDVAGPYSDSAALESLRLGYVSAALTWGVRPEPADDLVVEAVGADALAFIVHPSNQTGPLTRESLRRLFAGELSDWWAFGQSAGAVLPISREEGAGSRAVLEAEVMKGTGLSSGVAIAASDDAVLDYVASTPGAIGYVAASNLREGVRALTVEERRPEPQRVREGDYPLMVGVWLSYVPGGPGEDLARCLAGPSGARALARWYGAPELLVGPD